MPWRRDEWISVLGEPPGSDGLTAFALNPQANQRAADFPRDVRDLDLWIHGEALPEGHAFAKLKAQPQGETAPELWILGSSMYGAQVAAYFGMPYAFAWFFTDGQGGKQALDIYREQYRPSHRHPEPTPGICVWALAAETQEEAQYHFSSRAHWQLYRDRGLHLPFGSPEDALAAPYSDTERDKIAALRRKTFVGTGEEVAERIRELAAQLDVVEVAVVTWTHAEQARRDSYDALARAFGM